MKEYYKTYAPLDVELKKVLYMNTGKRADVFLRKNISIETLSEEIDGEIYSYDVQVADELYFIVDPETVTKEDIEENFEKYWAFAGQWDDLTSYTNEEIIEQLKEENKKLKQCIVEISSMI